MIAKFTDADAVAATKCDSDNDPSEAARLVFAAQPMPMTEVDLFGQMILIGRVTYNKVLLVPSRGFPHWHYYTVVRPALDEGR